MLIISLYGMFCRINAHYLHRVLFSKTYNFFFCELFSRRIAGNRAFFLLVFAFSPESIAP